MRPESLRICAECKEVYRAAKGIDCPKCASLKTLRVSKLVESSGLLSAVEQI